VEPDNVYCDKQIVAETAASEVLEYLAGESRAAALAIANDPSAWRSPTQPYFTAFAWYGDLQSSN
jgi:hypothetical protein